LEFVITILVLAVLLFCGLLLLLRPAGDAGQRMAPFCGHRYAHRGLHDAAAGIPENSLPAMRRAVEAGYGIELDLHLTTDGRLVVFHDDKLDRICGVSGRVDEKDWAELSSYRLLGTEERMPLFSEVLEIVGGKIPLIIEVKYQKNYAELCAAMMTMLKDYEGLYCVESFHPSPIRWMMQHHPEIPRGFLSDHYRGEGVPRRLQPAKWAAQELLFNWGIRPHFIAYHHAEAPKTLPFALCRRIWHAPCVAWTCRSEAEDAAAWQNFDAVIFEHYSPAPHREA